MYNSETLNVKTKSWIRVRVTNIFDNTTSDELGWAHSRRIDKNMDNSFVDVKTLHAVKNQQNCS